MRREGEAGWFFTGYQLIPESSYYYLLVSNGLDSHRGEVAGDPDVSDLTSHAFPAASGLADNRNIS